MRVAITIGEDVRTLDNYDETWITQQVNRRRRDGVAVCVQIQIRGDEVNVHLVTPGCGPSVGGRPANGAEKPIVELWTKQGLNTNDFAPGNLIAFLKQLRKILQ